MGERIVFVTNGVGTIAWPKAKKDHSLDPYLTAYIKSNSNLIIGLKIRAKIIKHLEDNIGENFNDLGSGKDFIDMMPQI